LLAGSQLYPDGYEGELPLSQAGEGVHATLHVRVLVDLPTGAAEEESMTRRVTERRRTTVACSQTADAGGRKSCWANRERQEPMEYVLLDYLNSLPADFVEKLKHSLEVHESLVQRFSRRNARLQELVRGRAATASEAPTPVLEVPLPGAEATPARRGAHAGDEGAAFSRSGDTAAKADGNPDCRRSRAEAWQRELRAQMADRIAAAQAARLRLGAEQQEAAMRARLEHTCRAARERIMATSRRTLRREEECRARECAARLERGRVQRELESRAREQAMLKVQVTELEEAIRVAEARARESDRARRVRAREAQALRNELKAHKTRAARYQQVEQRIKDLGRELQDDAEP